MRLRQEATVVRPKCSHGHFYTGHVASDCACVYHEGESSVETFQLVSSLVVSCA
jgi:hypothetical protein